MVRISKYWLVAIALFGGIIGGLISGSLTSRLPQAQAVAPAPQVDGYSIVSGGNVAFVVDSAGNVYAATSTGVKKLGQCR